MTEESYALVIIIVNQGGPFVKVVRGIKTKELAERAANQIIRSMANVSWGYSIEAIQES